MLGASSGCRGGVGLQGHSRGHPARLQPCVFRGGLFPLANDAGGATWGHPGGVRGARRGARRRAQRRLLLLLSPPPPPPPPAASPPSPRPGSARHGSPSAGAARAGRCGQPGPPRAAAMAPRPAAASPRLLPALLGLHVLAIALALEVSVGKTNTVLALNGSDVLLPCTFTTCIGFQDLVFTWYFNSTEMIYHGKIKSKTSEPFLVSRNPRVEFVGSTTGKDNNISIVLKDVELSDAGKYTCHVKNPREKNAQHNATIILTVVHRMEETDNTLTLIIVGVVGGLFGLLILFMLVKRVVLFIIKKTQDGKKECLVSSSGNDNTENGLAGSKAEQKAPPKA
uniref:Sodium voltage-gated channel beta subunit 4 n=1 Tax=Anser brachyrhynchus TaxID=132585 RepID=A0A8B9C785_9AVES